MEGTLSRCEKLTRYFYTVGERSPSLLCNQLQQAEEILDALVARPLLDFQKDALMCLVADIIGGYAAHPHSNFPDSVLLKALNQGMFQVAAAEFHTFCYRNGKIDSKAWQKRHVEQMLFSRGQLPFA